jgi:hypothetical protein
VTAACEPVTCPFTVLIDTAEGNPWTFQGLTADADQGGAPFFVPYLFECLGRHPHSTGDYSIQGLKGVVGIERKSMEDAWGTTLGWDTEYHVERGINGRRERFKRELENLAAMRSGIVIIEAPLAQCVKYMPGCDGDDYPWLAKDGEIVGHNEVRGKHTVYENQKIFLRSIVSWQDRYKGANWFFCADRREAEIIAFRFLEKAWQHYLEPLTRKEKRRFKAEIELLFAADPLENL